MARLLASPSRAAALASLVALAACAASSPPPPAVRPLAIASAAASASAASSASSASVPSSPARAPLADGQGRLQAQRDATQAGLCPLADLNAAREELRDLDQRMRRRPVGEALSAIQGRAVRLLGSPCFGGGRLAFNLDIDQLRAASSGQFKGWWKDGGEQFLMGSINRANALHFAPSLPTVLSPETLPPGDPRRAIVCPVQEEACDPLAEGTALDLGRELQRVNGSYFSDVDRSPDTLAVGLCAGKKPRKPGDDPLDLYTDCVTDLVPMRTLLPTAHYRSPRGWLVLRGRRGHHSFCDETRAYDLATGAAHIASRCSGLALTDDGQVDHEKTSRQSAVQTTTGTLSVDALRRLALFLWLKDSFATDVQPYAEFPLPEGVPMPGPDQAHGARGSGRGGWASSAQTVLSFTIVNGGQVLRDGEFIWPAASSIGDQIADDLTVAAEITLRPGCAPASLPADLARARPFGGVSGLDASAASLRASADELSKAMVGLSSGKGCKR